MRKILYCTLTAITFIFTVWYMHYGVPYENEGALSKIGLEHRIQFIVWGVLTLTTLTVGIISAYRRYTKSRLYVPLLLAALIGMALTLAFDFDFDKKPDYYFHCTGSLMFSVSVGVCVFLLFLFCYKQGAVFRVLTYLTAIILIADTVCLLIFKETGLIEALPIFSGYIMLLTVNLRGDKVEVKR